MNNLTLHNLQINVEGSYKVNCIFSAIQSLFLNFHKN